MGVPLQSAGLDRALTVANVRYQAPINHRPSGYTE